MASILELLGFKSSGASGHHPDAVHEIASRLERLGPERSRYVASFAVVLSRVAQADLDISDAERRKMEEIVQRVGHLNADEARVAIDVAIRHSNSSGGTEHFLATRELAGLASTDQRREVLDCLFALSAADGSISTAEESRVRQISSELGFSHREFAEARSRWNEYREILK